MNGKRFNLGKAPFIRKADLTLQNTSSFMRDFMIALVPLILFAWVKNGLLPFIDKNTNFFGLVYPLLLPILGGLFSVLLELGWWKFIIKDKPLKERMATSYAAIPGVLLGMIVPLSTPIWVLFIGVIFATVVAKLLFGGFGHNIFNPALIGYLFLTTYSYSGLMSPGLDSAGAPILSSFGSWGSLNPTEAIVSGATPMTVFSSNPFGSVGALIEEYGLLKMFLGFTPGALAETSALLCLLALIYLLVRKVINWRIPVIYIGTVFVLTYIIGAFNGFAGTLDFALFGIFNGGLMFGAVFMATEPVTSPRNPNGKVIYALALGVLTVVFRFASKLPEGVAVSILTLNMFTAIIERFATKLRVEPNKRKVVLSYSLVGLLLAGIATFPVVSSLPKEVEEPVEPVYEFVHVSNEQNYGNLNFIYTLESDGTEFTVEVDQAYKILEISNDDFNNDDAKEALSEIINKNKIVDFILSAEEGADYLTVVVSTKGYTRNPVISTITYDDNYVITNYSVEYDESYNEEYNQPNWTPVNGHPNVDLPAVIIDKQDGVTDADVIAGATVTSKAMFRSLDVAKGYIEYLDTITEVTLMGKTQDVNTLEFTYTFRHEGGKTVVTTDTAYEITSVVDAGILAEVEAAIAVNKFVEYIESDSDNKLIVITKAFGSNPAIKSTFTYDAGFNITAVSVVYDESYDYSPTWDGSTHPSAVMPGRIIENQDDLDDATIVTGATVTSNSILRAAKMAKEYLNILEGANE